MSVIAACNVIDIGTVCASAARLLRRSAYVISGVLLAAVSARAEAPVLSQEFWNYMVEFGDSQGEVFDPADLATMANMPAKTSEAIDRAQAGDAATVKTRQQDENSNRAPAATLEGQPR